VPYKIVTFESVHQALKAEKAVRSAGLKADAISVPRHLSSDCGIALRFDDSIEEPVIKIMCDNEINFRGIYPETNTEPGK
jgi:hypothetical protein